MRDARGTAASPRSARSGAPPEPAPEYQCMTSATSAADIARGLAACEAPLASRRVRGLLDPPFRELAGATIRVQSNEPDVAVGRGRIVAVRRVRGQATHHTGVAFEGEDLVLELPGTLGIAALHPLAHDLRPPFPRTAEWPWGVGGLIDEERRDLVWVVALPGVAVAGQ